MRIFIVFISIITTLSLAGNAGLGYYLYTFSLTNQQLLSKANTLTQDLKASNDRVDILSNTVSEKEKLVTYLNTQLDEKQAKIETLSENTTRLEALMCPRQLDGSLLKGKVTRNQVSRVIQTFYEDTLGTIINDVKYSGELYSNKNDFQMDLYYTQKEDNKNYKDSLTVTYSLFKDDSGYKLENDSVRIVMSTGCIFYVSTP